MTPAERLQAALTEIARRRVVAQHALTTVDEQLRPIHPPTPWHEPHEVSRRLLTSQSRAAFIAENDPSHMLEVLDMHHELLSACDEWMLSRLGRGHAAVVPKAMRALLDMYAPAGAMVPA